MQKPKFLFLCVIITVILLVQRNNAWAATQHIKFRPLQEDEITLAQSLLTQNYFEFSQNVQNGFIHFPNDIRIALVNLRDNGNQDIILYVHAGTACGTAGCDMLIWEKRQSDWENIGWEKSYDEGISILDKKNDGYHNILAAGKLLQWHNGNY